MPLLFNGVGGIKKATYNEALYKKVKFNGVIVHSGGLDFSYTGDWEFDAIGEEDLSGDFQIRFLTSGTLNIASHGSTGGYFDVFLVGGGGTGGLGGATYNSYYHTYQYARGGAGGAGYNNTQSNVFIAEGSYPLIIGDENAATSFANLYLANPGETGGGTFFNNAEQRWEYGKAGKVQDSVGVYAFGAETGNLYCVSGQDEPTDNSGNGGAGGYNQPPAPGQREPGHPGSSGVIVLRNHRG